MREFKRRATDVLARTQHSIKIEAEIFSREIEILIERASLQGSYSVEVEIPQHIEKSVVKEVVEGLHDARFLVTDEFDINLMETETFTSNSILISWEEEDILPMMITPTSA